MRTHECWLQLSAFSLAPGTSVQAWQHADGPTTKRQARTTKQGEVEFTLPSAGEWMISTVKMIAATDRTETEWESCRGNLTFSLEK